MTRQHKVLLEYVAQELHTQAFAALGVAEQQIVREDAEERYVSYAFLRQSGSQHGNLKVDLQNDFTTGDNRYPKNRQQTLHLLDKYSKTVVARATQSEGTSFAQRGGKGASDGKKKNESKPFDKKYWKDKECYRCHEKGHPATHCPGMGKGDDDKSIASTQSSVSKLKKDFKNMKKAFTTVNTQLAQLKENDSDISESDGDDEVSHFQVEESLQFAQVDTEFEPEIAKLLFKQTHGASIKLELREVWLLDNQSTMDLVCNEGFVKGVYKSSSTMRLKSNGGKMKVTHKGRIPGYHREVWVSKKAITNIICLKNLIKQYHVTYDSREFKFVVHRESEGRPNMEFRMHESGLHIYDPRKNESKNAQFAFINTVSENKKGSTKRQIKGAEIARTLYATLSYPSMKDFKWVIRCNQIKDCAVTVEDVDVAQKIWGKNIAALKGKTTRRKTIPVATNYVHIPKELLQLHKEVFLTTDIFFVNKIPFFLTLSRKICFTAVTHLADRTVERIFKAFKEIYQYYLQRNFRITTVHADGEYAPLKSLIESMPGGPTVNLASANEHVPEIERRIKVVKEQCRATRHSLPYQRIPKVLTVHIVLNVVKMLNFFPPKGGISETLCPKTIMSGETLDYKKHLSLKVGQYCQVHEEENPRNSQLARTKGAISLGPSGNLQGGQRFMALNTGFKIVRRNWDVIPTPDNVIARVEELGSDQPKQMIFTDRHGRLIGDIEIPGVDSNETDDVQSPGVDPAIDDAIEIPGVDHVEGPENPVPQVVESNDLDIPEADPAPIEVETVEEEIVPEVQAPVAPAPVAQPEQIPELRRSARVRSQPKPAYIPSMTGSKYSYAVTQLESHGVLNPDAHMFAQEDFYQAEPDVVAAIMTQLSLKAGLKEWGDEAFTAAQSEMKQLHFRDTFKPKHWRELTQTQRKTVLESHMFLKEKRDGKIKGRTVAGGNKQRDYISKEDASSPTVATESVLLSCIIDAEEGRDVAVINRHTEVHHTARVASFSKMLQDGFQQIRCRCLRDKCEIQKGRTDLRLGFDSPQESDKATHEATQNPKPLWDFCSTYSSKKVSAGSALQPRRTTRCAEVMTGETQDISEYLHI